MRDVGIADPQPPTPAPIRKSEARDPEIAGHDDQHGANDRHRTHGLPCTLAVQARSAIRMDVVVRRSSRLPGGDAQIRVSPAEAGIPRAHTVSVVAEISGPAAKPYVLPLPEVADGEFGELLPTPVAGLSRVQEYGPGRHGACRPGL
ncbi:hypothetical protein AB0G05_02105 [Nonomuraea wenchangensis]